MIEHAGTAGKADWVSFGRLQVPRDYLDHLVKDGHKNTAAFFDAQNQLFRGIDLRGKRVLEIGSGKGLIAALAALQGASEVVSMEPELAGATSGVVEAQRRRMEALGLRQVQVEVADFNTWEGHASSFDVILSRNSINHLYPSEHHARKDAATRAGYLGVARHIHSLLAPGGVFVATDASRHAFFTMARAFGVRRPWRWSKTGVNWRHHQNPGTWATLFREAGFSAVDIAYPVPHQLRALAPVVNTAVANFFLKGAFILHAHH